MAQALNSSLSPASLIASTESISENDFIPDWSFTPLIPPSPSDQILHATCRQAAAPHHTVSSTQSKRRKEQNRSS